MTSKFLVTVKIEFGSTKSTAVSVVCADSTEEARKLALGQIGLSGYSFLETHAYPLKDLKDGWSRYI